MINQLTVVSNYNIPLEYIYIFYIGIYLSISRWELTNLSLNITIWNKYNIYEIWTIKLIDIKVYFRKVEENIELMKQIFIFILLSM